VARAEDKNIVKVPVETLDAVMKTKKPPVVMKIDVEGFETEVINGGIETISAPSLQAVIIELRGHGARYGFDEQKLHDKLVSLSYQPYEYDGFTRKLSLLKSHFGAENTIYIRNLDFVNERIASAPQISMLGYNF
jgi:hypothetical protein